MKKQQWIFLLLSCYSIFLSYAAKAQIEIDQKEPLSPATLLSQYIQIPSVTGQELLAGQFLQQLFTEEGFHVRVFNDQIDAFNIAASIYPLDQGKPNIIFLSHMDVVPATEGGNPKYGAFSGEIANGRVWGRGALDNKGMMVMQFFAAKEFLQQSKTKELPYNITVLVVSGEETGGEKGAALIVENHLKELNPLVVFGEGGAGIDHIIKKKPQQKVFGIEVAAKRMLWLELSFKASNSGHSSVPPLNYPLKQNIVILRKLIRFNEFQKMKFSATSKKMFKELGQQEGGLRGFIMKKLPTFAPILKRKLIRDINVHSLVTNTITVTSFNTHNNAVNAHPTEIHVILDCRLLPETSTEKFISDLKRRINDDDIKLKIIKEGVAASATDHPLFFEITQNAIKDVYPHAEALTFLFPASNDNNYFRQFGIPVLGILPMFLTTDQIESIHGVDENVNIDELYKGITVYKNILKAIQDSALTHSAATKTNGL